MKTIRKFTCDALVRPCGCAKCLAQRRQTKDTNPTASDPGAIRTEVRVDLNEIHRRFWARRAGKE